MRPGKKKQKKQPTIGSFCHKQWDLYLSFYITYLKRTIRGFPGNQQECNHGMASPWNWVMAGSNDGIKTTSGVDTSTDTIQNMIDTWLFDWAQMILTPRRTEPCLRSVTAPTLWNWHEATWITSTRSWCTKNGRQRPYSRPWGGYGYITVYTSKSHYMPWYTPKTTQDITWYNQNIISNNHKITNKLAICWWNVDGRNSPSHPEARKPCWMSPLLWHFFGIVDGN